MRSARTTVGTLALLATAGGAVGCDSTQQRNDRAALTAERELLSREPLKLGTRSREVDVTRVTLLRSGTAGRLAVVVELRSRADRALTDVPIAVGLRSRRGGVIRLNAKPGLEWFQRHVPVIAPGGTTTWVFTGRRRTHAPVTPFAEVGTAAAKPSARTDGALPRVDAAVLGAGRARARARVTNGSGVPQYGLQVYLLARRGARVVAAGRTTVRHLGTGDRATVAVPLIGSAHHPRPAALAIPTVFR